MVALVWRREIVLAMGAHAVVVEARLLPKGAGYMVPRSFAVAFGRRVKISAAATSSTTPKCVAKATSNSIMRLGAPDPLVHLMTKGIKPVLTPIIGGGGSS